MFITNSKTKIKLIAILLVTLIAFCAVCNVANAVIYAYVMYGINIRGGGTYTEGDTITLSVDVSGYATDGSGSMISVLRTITWSGKRSGSGTSITITNATAANSGNYYCTATCSKGTYYASAYVTVLPSVNITKHPTTTNTTKGNTVQLTADASSSKGRALSYQWYKNGQQMADTVPPVQQMTNKEMSFHIMSLMAKETPALHFVDSENEVIVSGTKTNTLTITNAKEVNAGDYYCKITDTAGKTNTTNTARLSVATGEPLEAKIPVSGIVAVVGQNASISANAVGGTAPYTYQWRKNGEIISGATSSTLWFSNTSMANEGSYTCDITDNTGTMVSSNTATMHVGSGNNKDGVTSGTSIQGFITPLQIKAVVPTVITFHVDPNEPANYTSTPGGALTAPSFSFQNACNAPLSFGLSNISAQAGNPAVVSASAFTDEEWQNLTISETTNNIAFGIVGDDQSQWQKIYNLDAWYNLTPIYFGSLIGHTFADCHLKAKYGLAWGNATEQTITYDVVYIVTVAD